MNDKIKRLQEQIEEEERKIANCKHEFDVSFYNPETVKEGYGSVQDGAGSDPHWSYAGYHDVKKDRWTKKCTICGFEQHTTQKPIVKRYNFCYSVEGVLSMTPLFVNFIAENITDEKAYKHAIELAQLKWKDRKITVYKNSEII